MSNKDTAVTHDPASRGRWRLAWAVALAGLVGCHWYPADWNSFEGRFGRAVKKEERGNYRGAVTDYQRLLERQLLPNDRVNTLFRLGDCYGKLGSPTLAEQSYLTVAREYQDPLYLELAYGRLAECYWQAGRYRDALAIYPKLIALTKEDILLANIYFDQGRVCQALKQKREAAASFRQAIQRCQAVKRRHPGGDFSFYAGQIEDEVEQALARLD